MKNTTLLLSKLLILVTSLTFLNSCDSDSDHYYGHDDDYHEHDFPPFYVSNDHRSAVLDGVINSNSYIQFNQMIIQHPGIEVIYFDQAPGSLDDDVTALIGRRIHNRNIDTHILDNGIIASGAVDLFLAGNNRTRGFNTSVGVNSWEDSNGNQGSDFVESSSVHDFYINYYLSIGLGGQLANDFYFFSINAADSNDLYFLSESEIQFYQIFTEQIK